MTFTAPNYAVAPIYMVTSTDEVVICSGALGPVNIFLPSTSISYRTMFFYLKDLDAPCTILPDPASATINGTSSYEMGTLHSWYIATYDGVEWKIEELIVDRMAHPFPPGWLGSGSTSPDRVLLGDGTWGILSAAMFPIGLLNDKDLPRPLHYDRRSLQITANPGLTTFATDGFSAPATVLNVGTNNDQATFGPLIQTATLPVTSSVAGVTSATYAETQRGWEPEAVFQFRTGNSIVGVRVWVGLTSTTLDAVGLPTTEVVAALRYDTGVNVTGFWSAVSSDGTIVETTLGPVMDRNRNYTARIVLRETPTPQVQFWLDDVMFAAHITNIPSQTQKMGLVCQITTLTNAMRALHVSRISLTQK